MSNDTPLRPDFTVTKLDSLYSCMSKGWIGVDLDGTLARYDGWRGPEHIGEPIPSMVTRVKAWLAAGVDVRIFTARISGDGRAGVSRDRIVSSIQDWCRTHIGQVLPITCTKDFHLNELWDDRAVQVERNTGRVLQERLAKMQHTANEWAQTIMNLRTRLDDAVDSNAKLRAENAELKDRVTAALDELQTARKWRDAR